MNASPRHLLCLALAVSGAPAEAALSCSIPSAVSLAFGAYNDASASSRDVSVAFNVRCCRTSAPNPTVGTITITLGASTHSGQINTRQMKNGANTDLMSYQLYFTSYGGTVWGNGTTGGTAWTQSVSISATCGSPQVVAVGSSIFGRIFAQQSVSAGTYTDTVTISITP